MHRFLVLLIFLIATTRVLALEFESVDGNTEPIAVEHGMNSLDRKQHTNVVVKSEPRDVHERNCGGNQEESTESYSLHEESSLKSNEKLASIIVGPSLTAKSEGSQQGFSAESKVLTERKLDTKQILDETLIKNIPDDVDFIGLQITLSTNISTLFVQNELIPYFKSGKSLDRKSAYTLFYLVSQCLSREMALHDVRLSGNESIVVVGDIHGQYLDFVQIFDNEGMPRQEMKYLINGDFVDRGKHSIECMLTLFALKIAEPMNFFITRGNHETELAGRKKFYKDSLKIYKSDEFFNLAHLVFRLLPVGYLIQDEVFVCHGGVSPSLRLDSIRKTIKNVTLECHNNPICDVLWSDPIDLDGSYPSPRGLGNLFGPDVTRRFVEANNISMVIRSHQFKELGFGEQHDGLCATIFSCPNYKDSKKNLGAYIKLSHDLNLSYRMFDMASAVGKKLPILTDRYSKGRNIRRIR